MIVASALLEKAWNTLDLRHACIVWTHSYIFFIFHQALVEEKEFFSVTGAECEIWSVIFCKICFWRLGWGRDVRWYRYWVVSSGGFCWWLKIRKVGLEECWDGDILGRISGIWFIGSLVCLRVKCRCLWISMWILWPWLRRPHVLGDLERVCTWVPLPLLTWDTLET